MIIKINPFIVLFICCATTLFATDKKKVTSTSSAVKKAKIVHKPAIQNQQISAGIVEIQAADANDYYTSLNGNELLQLIGKNVNENSIQRQINSIKSDVELYNNAGTIMYLWRNEGLAFTFDNKSVLQQIGFLNAKEIKGAFCSAFQNQLPSNLSFSKTRNQIELNLERPVFSSTPTNDEKFYAEYLIENGQYNIAITYNTNSANEMNATINEVLVSANSKAVSGINTHISNVSTASKINNSEFVINNESKKNTIPEAINFIGRSKQDSELNKFISELNNNEIQLINYDQSSQYINKKEGIVLNYDKSAILSSVIYVNSNEYLGESCSQYQGRLPDGINFSLNMQEVNERMGSPMQVSNNMDTQYWEMYSINNGTDAMYISYNTKSSTIKSALISNIRVEKLK